MPRHSTRRCRLNCRLSRYAAGLHFDLTCPQTKQRDQSIPRHRHPGRTLSAAPGIRASTDPLVGGEEVSASSSRGVRSTGRRQGPLGGCAASSRRRGLAHHAVNNVGADRRAADLRRFCRAGKFRCVILKLRRTSRLHAEPQRSKAAKVRRIHDVVARPVTRSQLQFCGFASLRENYRHLRAVTHIPVYTQSRHLRSLRLTSRFNTQSRKVAKVC